LTLINIINKSLNSLKTKKYYLKNYLLFNLMSQDNTSSPVVSDEPVELVNPIELIDDVSKNLEILKKLVGIKPKKEKKEKKKSDGPKSVKLPKWVYLKEGYLYKNKVEGAEKKELKKYVMDVLLH